MCLAAAESLARYGEDVGMDEEHILPDMREADVYAREAVAVALKAQQQGVARLAASEEELYAAASQTIADARETVELLMREGAIRPVP
jgi:malate dehydrogenase (oxaloacetate-decarboxylating)